MACTISPHHFIRYEIRDWTVLGGQCTCGRGLPVLKSILGRRRNMLTLLYGDQPGPLTGYQTLTKQLALISPAPHHAQPFSPVTAHIPALSADQD